jgi:nicotinamide riboside transporter PnuC
LDAFATVGSLLGQALIVAGFAECWLAYLAADVALVVVSARADLRFYLVMYLVYCGLAWNGWREWTAKDGPHQGPSREEAN